MSTHQLALALFEELAPLGDSVQKAPSDIGFQKNNLFIDIVDLSLSARRAVDVAYFIVAQDPEVRKTYDVDLSFFKWLMDYSSRNGTHFRKVLREGQKGAVQVNDIDPQNPDNDRWISVQLLGTVGTANNRLYFEVPEKLQKHIKTPAASHFLSLRFVFTSVHAKVIYDRLQPYLKDECTPWHDLTTWRQWLGCTAKTYDQYRYLNRSVLEVALKQINEVSNLDVTYETKNLPGSKKVGQLRFHVKVKSAVGPTNATMLALAALYDTLQNEFGLSGLQFSEILANRAEWTDERLQKAIEYTRFNLERGKVTSSAAGYFMRALKEHFVVGSADRLIAQRQAQPQPRQTMTQLLLEPTPAMVQHQGEGEAKALEQSEEGLNLFKNLADSEQSAVLAKFCRLPNASLLARRTGIPKESLGEHVEGNDWIRRELGTYVFLQSQKAKKGGKKAA